MSIRIKNVSKRFKNFVALDSVSLQIRDGEFLALLGPSGSGKTTLLRVIAGLEQRDEGSILLKGEDISDRPLQKRSIGFVFQHYALFKHMSVYENIAFGLRVKPKSERPSDEEINVKVHKLLELVHLEGLEDKYPSQLSGGQKQRVALARILAVEPKYMLLDEPFGALDAKIRIELRGWLRNLHDTMGITTIFVTHDQEEALEVADRVVIMDKGNIVQVGTPLELWENPKNAFVYDFLGNYNIFYGWFKEDGSLSLCKESKPSSDHMVKIYCRPHEVEISKKEFDNNSSTKASITHINYAGPLTKIRLESPFDKGLSIEISNEIVRELDLKAGDSVWLKPKNYTIF
jgi:sulfate transport system ATP-binding protein